MSTIQELFTDYGSYHRTRGNKVFHRIGIPLIVLTLFGMLARLEITSLNAFRIDAAILLILLAEVYYLMLDWRLGLAMLGASIIFYVAGAAMPFWFNVALFVLGWILQFVGHSVYEKRQPAFFRNLVHLLVGPIWIVNDVVPVVKLPVNN